MVGAIRKALARLLQSVRHNRRETACTFCNGSGENDAAPTTICTACNGTGVQCNEERPNDVSTMEWLPEIQAPVGQRFLGATAEEPQGES